jgi:integrase
LKKSYAFYLHKRVVTKGSYWYVYYLDPITGKQKTAISINTLRKKLGIYDRSSITRRREVEYIAQKALDDGIITFGKKDPNFIEYVMEFWDFEHSDYIRRRNLKNPNSLGHDYTRNMRNYFKKHALPLLPSNLKLSCVTTNHVELIVNTLFDDGLLANATILKVVQSMSVPLNEAKRLRMISHNPVENLESISTKPKRRGILTSSELHQIILIMRRKSRENAFDPRVYLATVLSAFTGMRQGEIRALKAGAITLINSEQGIITVSQSIAVYAGMKSTKGKRERFVPCPRWLCEDLLQLASRNPYGTELVFWSDTTQKNPISSSFITLDFNKTVADLLEEQNNCVGEMVEVSTRKLGEKKSITKGEFLRRERNIVFHSLRHYYVTFMRGKVGDNLLQSVVGHQSTAMTNNYTHETEERLLEVGRVSCNILPSPHT